MKFIHDHNNSDYTILTFLRLDFTVTIHLDFSIWPTYKRFPLNLYCIQLHCLNRSNGNLLAYTLGFLSPLFDSFIVINEFLIIILLSVIISY